MSITDEQAVVLLKKKVTNNAKVATTPVTRTIFHAVEVEKISGGTETVIRPYVRMYEYVSAEKWEKALAKEKEFAKLNDIIRKDMKEKGYQTDFSPKANPLNFTPLKEG